MFAFYLFLLTGIALMVFFGSYGEAVNTLVKMEQGLGGAGRFTSALGLAVSAGVVWFFHWRAYRSRLRTAGDGMHGLSMVYLFLLSFGFGLWAMLQAATLVELVTEQLMGLVSGSGWLLTGQAAKLAVTVGLWVEHLRLLFAEAAFAAAKSASEAAQA
ncbi:MAG: hypothetical protein KF701_06580 [Anaerolineales bacterium]|nr:MAG: hypothetical protein KF701_06580 [Anaerolineales bacterium]